MSAHGFGHLAQLAPVLTVLHQQLSGLRITLQSTILTTFTAQCLPPGFRQIAEPADVVMPMDSPLDTRWSEALETYKTFCQQQPAWLRRQRELLLHDRPDLVLSNVAWLPLLAARDLGIPSVGLCSLNWLDILRLGPLGEQLDPIVVEQLTVAYQAADLFMRPTPAMPMAWLDNGMDIGPVARVGTLSGGLIRTRLGLSAQTRLVMYQLGGIGGESGQVRLPRLPDVHWLLPNAGNGREDCSPIMGLGLPFIDVLASCDLMLTKPGYGSVVEAACNGVPVLYVARGDWPEEPYLLEWLARQLPAAEVSRQALAQGCFGTQLEQMLALPRPQAVAHSGVDEAAAVLLDFL